MLFEPIYIPRALNTETCIQQGDRDANDDDDDDDDDEEEEDEDGEEEQQQ